MHCGMGNLLYNQINLTVVGVLLGVIILSSNLDISEARSLPDDDSFFPSQILKRNTWWSKKSLDSLQTVDHDTDRLGLSTDNYKESLQIYACYVEKCVPSFVTCARRAETEQLFGVCEMLHRMCASSCSNDDSTSSL